jgi:hypothetical protein
MDTVTTPTWAHRELPILAAALRRLDNGETFPSLEVIRAEVGLEAIQMRAGLSALETAQPPYIAVRYTMAGPEHVGGFVTSVSERTRRLLGSWPSAEDLMERLVAALQEEATTETQPERRSRLREAAEVLGGMAREIAVQVLAAQLGKV